MRLEINNLQQEIEFNPEFEELLDDILAEVAKVDGLDEQVVSLALVNDQKIAQLNKQYRNKKGKTDVLSFPQDDEQLLGDIAISLETAQEQALEYGHSLTRELGFLFLHGVLHLLGYTHYEPRKKELMRQKEEFILNKLELKR